MITYPNIDKIKKLIKWKSKVKFREGILKTISYYKNNMKVVILAGGFQQDYLNILMLSLNPWWH